MESEHRTVTFMSRWGGQGKTDIVTASRRFRQPAGGLVTSYINTEPQHCQAESSARHQIQMNCPLTDTMCIISGQFSNPLFEPFIPKPLRHKRNKILAPFLPISKAEPIARSVSRFRVHASRFTFHVSRIPFPSAFSVCSTVKST